MATTSNNDTVALSPNGKAKIKTAIDNWLTMQDHEIKDIYYSQYLAKAIKGDAAIREFNNWLEDLKKHIYNQADRLRELKKSLDTVEATFKKADKSISLKNPTIK